MDSKQHRERRSRDKEEIKTERVYVEVAKDLGVPKICVVGARERSRRTGSCGQGVGYVNL